MPVNQERQEKQKGQTVDSGPDVMLEDYDQLTKFSCSLILFLVVFCCHFCSKSIVIVTTCQSPGTAASPASV